LLIPRRKNAISIALSISTRRIHAVACDPFPFVRTILDV
jgi:hypothetical protein